MYFKKLQPQNQLNTKILSGNLDQIPWEEAHRIYQEAADLHISNLLEAAEHAYNQDYQRKRQQALQLAGISETEASYEGDLGIPYEPPTLTPEQEQRERYKAGSEAIYEYFLKPYHIKQWGVKILDQIVQEFSRHRLNAQGAEGTISGLQYLKDNIDPKLPRIMGIYRFLMLDKRSEYLQKQNTGEAKKYSSLVPLILYAHKLYNNTPYSQWERESLHRVVNPLLAEAMLTQVPELTQARLLELREIGLQQAGKTRPANTSYNLNGLKNTELGHCNNLVKTMMCQTWVAHPQNRTKYMVLDPLVWDRMPPPIVSTSIFREPPQAPARSPQVMGGGDDWT
jgi:hypothetical protein